MSTKLSIVIPAYNEAKNLKRGVLEEVKDFLKGMALEYEVIIVDDGSIDETKEVIEEYVKKNPKFNLIQVPHGGKANAVMTGMLASNGEIILFTDMDQATPINQLEKFIPKFEEGFDIVIGSRQGRKGAPLARKLAAWGFSVLRNIILDLPFTDTQCGFKAFNKKAVEKIIPKIKSEWGVVHFKGGAVNAGFDVEVLYLAKKYGFNIAEVGVEWNYVDTERVQVIKDAAAAIYDMFRIRINDLRGKY
ncbi:MAG: Glycosyl transferase family protein [Microgenomates group bacterium Gr01-1014_7]|nr:MAG: Glycosyl transferase family protein [Microgenomates group bacterium Gr01-1014_7]